MADPSRHFELDGEPVRRLLLQRHSDTSDRLHFALRVAQPRDEFPEAPELRVRFSYQGWPCGGVRLEVPLA